MEKIQSLTDEQKVYLNEALQQGLRTGRRTDRINKDAVTRIIGSLYQKIGELPPEVQFFSSPFACLQAQLEAKKKEDGNSASDNSQKLIYAGMGGNHWISWIALYDFCRKIGAECTPEQNELLDLWVEESRECHWWWPYKGLVFASDHPDSLHVDDQGRLHAEDRLAISYTDGWGIYAWHGIRVEKDLILHPELLTIYSITSEQNAEIRRIKLQRYGLDRYISDTGALPLHADSFGTLYRTNFHGETSLFVRVQNTTVEPDGSYKYYTFGVDDDLRPLPPGEIPLSEKQTWFANQQPQALTAHNAVASLHGLKGEQYHPCIET